MFCKHCGSKIPDDSVFCKKCGKNLEEGPKASSPTKDKKPQKDKRRRKLPLVLGITIPIIAVLAIAALIFTGVIPFPFLNKEGNDTVTKEEVETSAGSSETIEEPQKEDKEVTVEPIEEEPEEIHMEYHSECDLSFDEGNTFEISQEGLDLGHPDFSFIYPDGWEVEDIPEGTHGYYVRFKNPITVNLRLEESGMEWDQPLMDERLYILNDEFQTMEPADIIDMLWESNFELEGFEILTYENIDDEMFFIIWQVPDGTTFWEHFRFSDINGKMFIYIVASIDYCYDPWSDILINTAIDERLIIEEETIAEYIEEETEGPQATKPIIGLEIIEGPVSEEGVCYYRVAANIGGSPSPNITFNRDDSNGAWGSDVAQINLTNPDDSFTLTATASNSAGSATDSLLLSWGCEVPIEEPKDETKDNTEEEANGKDEDEGNRCPVITKLYQVDAGLGSAGGYVVQGGTAYVMTQAEDSEGDNIYYSYYVLDENNNQLTGSGTLEDPYWGFTAPDYSTTITVIVWVDDGKDCLEYAQIEIIVQRAFVD